MLLDVSVQRIRRGGSNSLILKTRCVVVPMSLTVLA